MLPEREGGSYKFCISAYTPMMLLSDLLNKLRVGKTGMAKRDTMNNFCGF